MEIRIPIHDPNVLNFWATQAAAHGRSVEEEIGAMIEKSAALKAPNPKKAKKEEAQKRIHDTREHLRKKYGNFPDSTALIREIRDES